MSSETWLVTWSPKEMHTAVLHATIARAGQNRRLFASQKEAVRFVMEELDQSVRRSAQLFLSEDQPVGIVIIEQMYGKPE